MKTSLAILTAAFWLFACKIGEVPTFFIVFFEVDGGSAVAPLNVLQGAKIVQPKPPTKPDYRFVGWYTDKQFSVLFDFKAQTITQNTTLYAQWKWEPSANGGTSFTVTFEVDGGSAIAPLTVSKGAKIVQPKPPTKQDYRFVGWYTDKQFSVLFDFKAQTITQNTTLYAQWKWEPSANGGTSFTVTFAVDGGSAIAPLTVSKGAKIVPPKPPTKQDYRFVGWYTDQKFSEVFDFKTQTITQNTTLYAYWQNKRNYKPPQHCRTFAQTEHPQTKAELSAAIQKAVAVSGASASLNHIDTSAISDMSELFKGKVSFNGRLDCWDTSKVTNMKSMFSEAIAFNQDIGAGIPLRLPIWKVCFITQKPLIKISGAGIPLRSPL